MNFLANSNVSEKGGGSCQGQETLARVYFYYHLINEKKLQINTLETIHTVLHPTFQLAVRDDIIRTNPSDGVMAQVKKKPGRNHGVRHALTVEQRERL